MRFHWPGTADLTETFLARANLSGADLFAANLSGADLKDANLLRADLIEANLSGTNLKDSNLSGSNFALANLTTTTPYKYHLICEDLMGRSYCTFPWPPEAQSGAVYNEGYPPNIDPSLLVHFSAFGDKCTWVSRFYYVECAG